MHAYRHRSPLRLSLHWLLWLAMLLPMAQLSATWHAYSHAMVEPASQPDDRRSPHTAHCDLCLTAAALSGAALLGDPPAVPLALVRHAPPPAADGSVWLAMPALPYLSRAPPLLRTDR